MKKAKSDENIINMPRMMNVNTFISFFSEKPSNNFITDFSNNEIYDTPCGYNSISYFISGISIFIARILGGSIADIYITGRIFNLFGYMVLMVLAFKILPYKKNVFYSIAFMPMILVLAAVYSPDGICLALATLFLAYCFKLKEKGENITLKELVILLVLIILVSFMKSIGYIGLLLCIFILPLKNMYKEHKKLFKYIFGIMIISLFIVLSITYNAINIEGDPRVRNTDTRAQFQYILANPLQYIIVLLKHFINTFTSLKGMSFLNGPMFFRNTYLLIYIIMITYLLFISIIDSSKHFKLREKTIFCLSFLIVFASISTVMYLSFTPVKARYIDGYQMRYMFPTLGLILISLSSKKISLKNKLKYNNMYISYIMATFLIVSILDVALHLA